PTTYHHHIFSLPRVLLRSLLIFPYTTLFRSKGRYTQLESAHLLLLTTTYLAFPLPHLPSVSSRHGNHSERLKYLVSSPPLHELLDRKSTRLNFSHVSISYAVFCLKNKSTSQT